MLCSIARRFSSSANEGKFSVGLARDWFHGENCIGLSTEIPEDPDLENIINRMHEVCFSNQSCE